jgi:hypothetical protein
VWAEGSGGIAGFPNLIRGRFVRRTPPFEPVPADLGPVLTIRDAGAAAALGAVVAHEPVEDTFLVVWLEGNGLAFTVQAARLDAAGTVLAPGPFRLDTTPCLFKTPAAVAASSVDREWLVVWGDDDSAGCVGTGQGVNARRVLADGSMPALPFDVSANGTANVVAVALAHAAATGPAVSEYLVVYTLQGIPAFPFVGLRARRVSGAGVPQGPELDVSVTGVNVQDPAVAHDPRSGQFLLTWLLGDGILEGQLLPHATDELGPRFPIGEPRPAAGPSVASSPAGPAFLVAWPAYRDRFDGDDSDIFAQFLGAAGGPAGPELSVSRQPGSQGQFLFAPGSVACGSDGGCLAIWHELPATGDRDLAGRFLFPATAEHFAVAAPTIAP